MNINWFTCIKVFDGCICYMKISGVKRFMQLYQRNNKLLLLYRKQVNYPLIRIYEDEAVLSLMVLRRA